MHPPVRLLALNWSLERPLARAIDSIVRVLALPHPDMERVGMALSKARAYKPALSLSGAKHPKQAKQAAATKAPPTPRYFALLAEIDLVDTSTLNSRQERRPFGVFGA